MFDFTDGIMGFIYKHSYFRRVCWYIFLSLTITLGFVSYLFITNEITPIIPNLFNLAAYQYLMSKYKAIICSFLIIEQIGLIYLILWQSKKLKEIHSSPREQIHIKDIAELWTQFNAPIDKQPVVENAVYNEKQNIATINETILSVANFKHTETLIFMNDIVKPIAKRIGSGHLKTIIRLLNLLELNKDCPSVVNFAKNDPNNIYQDREIVTFDKKTKYDIYELISVYRHSLNVARNAVDLLSKDKSSIIKNNLMAKLVIVALAHDIGKITRYEIREQQKREISFEDHKKMPHQVLSAMILYEAFKDCPDLQEIAEVVEKHHNATVEKDEILLGYLITADCNTRKDEIHKYKLGEDICDLKKDEGEVERAKTAEKPVKVKPKQETQQETPPQPKDEPQIAPQSVNNRLFSPNISDDFDDKRYPNIKGIALISVGFDKQLTSDDYKTLEKLLENNLQGSEYSCYTKEKGFCVLASSRRDKAKVFDLAYDISQRISKSEFKTCYIGFVMAKEAQNAADMIEKANLALEEARKSKTIVDFKDIKNKDSGEKITISDKQEPKKDEKKVESKEKSPANTEKKAQAREEMFVKTAPETKEKPAAETEKKSKAREEMFVKTDTNVQTKPLPQEQEDEKAENKVVIKDEMPTDTETSDVAAKSGKKETNELFKQVKLSGDTKIIKRDNEKEFDITRIETQIFNKLAQKINTNSGSFYIESITFRNFVLFTRRCLAETLAEILKSDADIDKKVNFFIRYYRKHENEDKRYIWFVGIDKGFYESIYYIKNENQDPIKMTFVPFESKKTFNLDAHQLESNKRNSPFANYKVIEFGKYKESSNEKKA